MHRFLRLVLVVGFLAALTIEVKAEGWMMTWGGPSGDGADWIEITSDSGYIIAGSSLTPKASLGTTKYGYLTKTNAAGGIMWMRAYPMDGLVPHSELNSVQETGDGGYVAVGYRVVWLEEWVSQDLLILKTDATGDTLWTRSYGGDQSDRGYCIRQVPDGGYVIAGEYETKPESGLQKDMWLLRTDSLGDTLWTRILGEEDVFDWAYCVNLTSDGSYIITGGNGTVRKIWVLKVDDEGDVLWQQTYDMGGDCTGSYVEETADGGFIVTGKCGSGQTADESFLYILKLSENGDSLWARIYGTSGRNQGRCVHQTEDGGYVIAGYQNGFGDFDPEAQGWLLRTDPYGDTLWTRSITWDEDGLNDLYSFQFAPDGGYIIAGKAGDYGTEKGYEFWLVKTDSLGYVPIQEDQIEVESNLDTSAPLGKPVEIRYTNMPGGFHAYVYDSIGRKIDEVHNADASGTVSWGEGHGPGVYFIREISSGTSHKVVLVR